MRSKQKLTGALVGLKEMNASEVINEPAFLTRELCAEGDVPLVRRMAAIIDELFDTFDYAKSPEFLRLVKGKSTEVQAMRLKMITPLRRTEMRKRFGEALAKVFESDDVLDLVEPARHERIKELRNLLFEVSNPDVQIP
jgi:hypothetical protein